MSSRILVVGRRVGQKCCNQYMVSRLVMQEEMSILSLRIMLKMLLLLSWFPRACCGDGSLRMHRSSSVLSQVLQVSGWTVFENQVSGFAEHFTFLNVRMGFACSPS